MFVLPRVRYAHRLRDSLVYGGTFGLIVYGVYDATAAAVLKKWDIKLATIDVAWGAFLFFVATYVGKSWTVVK